MTEIELIEINKKLRQFLIDIKMDDAILVFLNKKEKGAIGLQFTNVNKNDTLINLVAMIITYLNYDDRKKLYEGILTK